MKTTTKAERRAAKKDAIGWHRICRKGGWFLRVRHPDPRMGVAAWARYRRTEPVPISVEIKLPIRISTEPK